MDRSPVLVGLAAVLAGSTVAFAVLGAVYHPLLLTVALPFAVATAVVWHHVAGRLIVRQRERAPRQAERWRGGAGQEPRRSGAARQPSERAAAARVLGVDPGAETEAIRRAFRDRARELHPDAPDGDETAFRRARDAYERLTEG